MPRSPYDRLITGSCTYSRPDGSQLSTVNTASAFRFTETSTGTSRRKPKAAFLQPTSYTFLSRSIQHAHGSCLNKHKTVGSFGQWYRGVVGGGTGVAGRFNSESHFDATMSEIEMTDPNCANQALIKARNALKSSDINLGIAFAERDRTARLVGDTALRLGKSFRHLRRGEIRNAMDTLGISSSRREPRGSNVPKKWLELQYGWKPLLSDVHGACDALNKRNKSDWRITARGRHTSLKTYVKTFADSESGVMTARSDIRAFCRIDALPKNEAIISLASLGITNPLLIGWELLPFSFVVDWFIPIGSYLEGLDALLGYESFSYSNSVLIRATWDGKGTNAVDGDFTITNNYSESKRVVSLNRTVSTNVPSPHIPRIKDPRSLGHMANGLALLATVFGKR